MQLEYIWDLRLPRTNLLKIFFMIPLVPPLKPTKLCIPFPQLLHVPRSFQHQKPTQPWRIKNSTCTQGYLIKAQVLHLRKCLPFRKLEAHSPCMSLITYSQNSLRLPPLLHQRLEEKGGEVWPQFYYTTTLNTSRELDTWPLHTQNILVKMHVQLGSWDICKNTH